MVDQHVAAGHPGGELHDSRAARGDQRGLHILLHIGAALVAHLIEDGADHVEARHQVGTAVADEDAHRLAGLGMHRLVARERAFRAVEEHVGRALVDGLFHVERLRALLAVFAGGIEIALHHVVLVVHLGQAFRRFDQDQAIHAVGDMHADRRRGAVVHIDPLIEGLEGELRFVARRGEARRRAAARPGHAVQVDVVRHLAVRVVLEVELHRIALPHADEAAGHRAAEGPEGVADPFGDRHFLLDHLQLHDDLGRIVAVDRRRHVGRTREHRADGLAARRTEIAGKLGCLGRRARQQYTKRHRNQARAHQTADRLKTAHFFLPLVGVCRLLHVRSRRPVEL